MKSNMTPDASASETPADEQSPAGTCWADLTGDARNTLIGERLGAQPLRNIWLQWTIKGADGSVIGRRNLGQLGSMSMADAEQWLADAKKSKAEWTRRGVQLDWLLRDEITLFEQRWHLRYSDTPGGGWRVVEAIHKAGYSVQIATCRGGWRVSVIVGPDPVSMVAETMAEAACQVGLLVLPNVPS